MLSLGATGAILVCCADKELTNRTVEIKMTSEAIFWVNTIDPHETNAKGKCK
jgi:hypothetical protein